MSNPSRAPRESLTAAQLELSRSKADAFYDPPAASAAARIAEVGKDLHYLQARVGQVQGLEIAASVVVDKKVTVDPWVRAKKKPAPYGDNSPLQLRTRTKQGAEMRNVVLGGIPEEVPAGWEELSREKCRARAANTVFASGCPTHTLGRLIQYLPGDRPPARPVTREEAEISLVSAGLRFEEGMDLRPHQVGSDTHPIYVNVKSSNGLPVMGHFEGEAMDKVLGLMQSLDESATRAFAEGGVDAVLRWVRAMSADSATAQYVTCLGRCKADYYTLDKVYDAKLRFYNVLPRQLVLIMQRATQVLEKHARHVGQGIDYHSFSGLTLVRGGATELVEALQKQLDEAEEAFVHMGDDSWVVLDDGGELVQFALDCSSFDLTQHADVTAEVHRALYEELRKVDEVAAAVWYVYVRGRPVVTAGTLVRWWYHGGPSGCPLQSKVNGVLMDVFIRRVLAALRGGELSEYRVREVVERVGKGMGFTVKLEQFQRTGQPSLREALRTRPFLFVGMWFYEEWDQVRVFCDLARQVAQLPYPGLKWVAPTDLAELEAVRLASTILSWGVPPGFLSDMVSRVREHAARLLEQVPGGGVEHPRAKWAVESASGTGAPATAAGLKRALEVPAEVLWLGERELPSTSVWVAAEEEMVMRRGRRLRVPTPRERVPGSYDAEIHGPARRNDGRPPPTTVWGPDRAPRPLPVEQVRSRAPKNRRSLVRFELQGSDLSDGEWSEASYEEW